MKSKNPVIESRRYIENAQKVLRENGDLDVKTQLYQDEKYVRAAGHYLWLAVLLMLDSVFHVRTDRRTRVDINAYLEAIRKRDRKLLGLVNSSYDIMHLYMGYDGVQRKAVCDDGISLANDIIDRCALMLAEHQD